ncbi:MAG: radical SAM protein [bacterium]
MTFLSRLPNRVRIRTRRCRTALSKSRIPGADYSVNPYLGCSHGCVYCYASFLKRYYRIVEPWGSFVEAKVNLPAVLQRERKMPGKVFLGTVCDPYQPVEAIFKLSRQVLEILGRAGFKVEVLTKSNLILRDLEIMKRYPGFGVELTVTTLDERVRQIFEPGAVPVDKRLRALARLVEAGVPTTVFVGPVLPYFSDSREELEAIFRAIARAGVRQVLVDRFNYLNEKLPVLRFLLKEYPKALRAFERANRESEDYAASLRERVTVALQRTGLKGGVVF